MAAAIVVGLNELRIKSPRHTAPVAGSQPSTAESDEVSAAAQLATTDCESSIEHAETLPEGQEAEVDSEGGRAAEVSSVMGSMGRLISPHAASPSERIPNMLGVCGACACAAPIAHSCLKQPSQRTQPTTHSTQHTAQPRSPQPAAHSTSCST